MGNFQKEDLRKRCLKKNFQLHLDSVKHMRSKQDVISQGTSSSSVDYLIQSFFDLKPNGCTKLATFENKKQPVKASRKRPLEESFLVVPSKKQKTELNKYTPTKHKPFGTLTELPQVQVSDSQKCNPIPEDVLAVYLEAQHILECAESDIRSFFVIEEIKEGTTQSIKRPILTTIAEDAVFEEVDSLLKRHVYKKIYNARLRQFKELVMAIEKSNNYLALLRKTIQTLPVYSDHVPKLISTFNRVFLAYKCLPAHRTIIVALQQMDLIKVLVKKFNKNHGLSLSHSRN